jgi:hypothetical protein
MAALVMAVLVTAPATAGNRPSMPQTPAPNEGHPQAEGLKGWYRPPGWIARVRAIASSSFR